ncbi:SIR2 family protein [Pseudoalteromonas sp. APC 3355]|uniref:SIR2 family protein n=1 Tax=Pseudoalteromonas sp. APC 3355 TaxID=3035199 RepID=UPI0025B3CAAE|nr:SIR2 family protein [Pseudoalteromonas sp. APC 3355]MDN3473758.1 SIR2 family protein [Pseudoalteromonas sp. APC 3355]
MEVIANNTQLVQEHETLINKIKAGKAILFTGAGFSYGAINSLGNEPLGAKSLSNKLSEELDIEKHDDLMFTSDYFLSVKSDVELINILKENYTLKSTSSTQNSICSLPWTRVYTTNYDLSVEIASQNSGKVFETIDISHSFGEFSRRGTSMCVHLNGSINSLNSESLNKSFKLSNSSYVSPESFINSEWRYCFKNDLDRANAIVFIGYSLYDIDIQRLLFDDSTLKDKTYFITVVEPDIQTKFTLSKYGKVISIGADGFAELIDKFKDSCTIDFDYHLQSMSKYEISSDEVDIRDNDVEKLLLHGNIPDSHVDYYMLGDMKVPYLVHRNYSDIVINSKFNDRHSIFYSSLGNGKSLLLKQLKVELSKKDLHVYEIDDIYGDYRSDLDYLSKLPFDVVLILDDYEQHIDVIEYVSRSKIENITIVASARLADHEFLRDQLIGMDFSFDETNIDLLFDDEITELIAIFDNLGQWADKATTISEKKRYIKRKNESQISLALIDFFNSPIIKSKIKELVDRLEKNDDFKETVLSICLCKIIGVPATKSLISDVSGNDAIYTKELTSTDEFKQLFNIRNGEVINSSSIFCICLMKEHYSAAFVTKNLLRIASKFEGISLKDPVQEKVFKAMLKFSFIERILPNTTKVGNLQRYYEDLKINIPWLRVNPHFWLQYAMTFIAFKDYVKAQKYLNEAYDYAEKKQDYHTNNIDTQQARLWLKQSNIITDGNIVYSNFEKANNLLKRLRDDIYKYRQVSGYYEFFETNFIKLSKKNKVNFIDACNRMLKQINKLQEDDKVEFHYLDKTKKHLEAILK